jgi:hypothetical protein
MEGQVSGFAMGCGLPFLLVPAPRSDVASVALPPPQTPRSRSSPSHPRTADVRVAPFLAARSPTSSATRPARAQPDGTRRASLEMAA